MKLHGIDNTYTKEETAIVKAIRAVLIKQQFHSVKDFEHAVKAVVEAFKEGMNRGYGGQPSDDATVELYGFLAVAHPQSGFFELYRKIG